MIDAAEEVSRKANADVLSVISIARESVMPKTELSVEWKEKLRSTLEYNVIGTKSNDGHNSDMTLNKPAIKHFIVQLMHTN